jgi:hypothetical protein
MKLRFESAESVEDSDPEGKIVFRDSGPDRIENHPGLDLERLYH